MKKLMLLAAAGVGYVLGSKAGRERYEQIMGTFNKVKDDPRVQEKAHQAADFAAEKAPVVKDKVADTASAATSKVTGGGSSGPSESTDELNPDRLKLGEDTGPQGALP
jgi:hypothetical protein